MKKLKICTLLASLMTVCSLCGPAFGGTENDITYCSLNVPNIGSYFKSYMDYRCITDASSLQYNYIRNNGWCDSNDFMRERRDAGIDDDYYMIALGSYYGTQIGTKYKITTNTGNIFYGVLCDSKSDEHTNSTRQYNTVNKNIVEFIVDIDKLDPFVRKMGSANVYMPLNGTVSNIERIERNDNYEA